MADITNGARARRGILVAAMAIGLTAGAYGVASAASGSGSSSAAAQQGTAATTAQPPQGGASGGAYDPQHPWGGQRSDETVLTGDALAQVTAAAKAKLPGAEIIRVETDADGHAAYEAHVVTATGNTATVYVGKDFSVTSVEQR